WSTTGRSITFAGTAQKPPSMPSSSNKRESPASKALRSASFLRSSFNQKYTWCSMCLGCSGRGGCGQARRAAASEIREGRDGSRATCPHHHVSFSRNRFQFPLSHPRMPRVIRRLPLLLLFSCVQAQEPSLASGGRVQLQVPADAPPLKKVTTSVGQVSAGTWLDDPAARERLSDVGFPVQWWRWKAVTIRFVPSHDGEVELMLGGPWKEAGPGVL